MGADYTARFARRPAPDRVHRRRILPRSRHRPVAATEGSLTRKVNKTGVRLWSDCPLDEHREVRRGHLLDAIADRSNRSARSDPQGPSVRAPPGPVAGQASISRIGKTIAFSDRRGRRDRSLRLVR